MSSIAVCPHNPPSDAHKFSRGKLMLCGGSRAYPGAVCLSAWASEFAGVGYTEVFTEADHRFIVQLFRPSVVVRSFEELTAERFGNSSHSFACVVGPGIDQDDATARDVLLKAITSCKAPLLIDGGALSFLSEEYVRDLLVARKRSGLTTVLTPHAGEAARLSRVLKEDELCQNENQQCQNGQDDQGEQSAQVADAKHAEDGKAALSSQENLSEQACRAVKLARCYASIVVLKGENTVISDGKKLAQISHGTPALAKAGTGDVLAGIIGSELAQGLEPFTACVYGASLHADAGNIATQDFGMISTCAEEVIKALPKALSEAQKRPRTIAVQSAE